MSRKRNHPGRCPASVAHVHHVHRRGFLKRLLEEQDRRCEDWAVVMTALGNFIGFPPNTSWLSGFLSRLVRMCRMMHSMGHTRHRRALQTGE